MGYRESQMGESSKGYEYHRGMEVGYKGLKADPQLRTVAPKTVCMGE